MHYLSVIFLYSSLAFLFSYFSFFIQIDESPLLIKVIVFFIPTIIFTFFSLLYFHFYKLKELTNILNLILFAVTFIVFSNLSSSLYTKLIYFNLNQFFIKENYIMPDIEYVEFLQDSENNNRDRLFFYVDNKNYIIGIEERLNYQVIKIINEINDKELKKYLTEFSKDNVITKKEFDSIRKKLIVNESNIKEDKNLNELYKIIFVFGKNYGKD